MREILKSPGFPGKMPFFSPNGAYSNDPMHLS